MGNKINNSVDISVIIPAYNAERTLERSIKSAIAQDVDNIEIIIVNDGSSDLTQTIATECALRDRRIRVINQPNSGLGATRNRGIREAKGDVIALLDSDDEFTPHSLSRVLDTLGSSGADLIASDIVVVGEDGCEKTSSALSLKHFPEGSLFFGSETKSLFCRRVLSSFCPTYFYKRSFLVEHEIKFPSPGRFLEDIVFMSELLSKEPTVACLAGGPTYRYYMRNDSMAHSKDIDKAKQALESIRLTERNLVGVRESGSFIIEQLLFAYYLASDDGTAEGRAVRSIISMEIRKKPFSDIMRLSLKDIFKTSMVLANARPLIRLLYRQ